MSFTDLGKITYKKNCKSISLPLVNIPQEISVHADFIAYREDEHIRIYDRKCDHNGGKLCLLDSVIKCPMHDWTFDARVGKYTNIEISKKELDYEIIGDNLVVNFNHDEPTLPGHKKLEITITYLSHACLLIETNEVSFITDPWIVGFAFASGWWPKSSPPKDWRKIVNSVDFIYISHNHPDHLNLFTLKYVREDMEYIVPDFESQSVSKMLIKNGFNNIFKAKFQNYYRYKNTELLLTIFKSGDFRDDSGLYFTYGNFSFLSTVDSNDLNFQKFPTDVTLFASSFAGGASGYPLCFETVNSTEKIKVLDRNRKAIKATVRQNIKRSGAKFFLPYAGFFTEGAQRDLEILQNNRKNTVEDFTDVGASTRLLNINEFDKYFFNGSKLFDYQNIQRDGLNLESPEVVMESVFYNCLFSESNIQSYFDNCSFQKELILYLTLTNDNFSKTYNSLIVDFRGPQVDVNFINFNWQKIKKDRSEKDIHNILHIKVRQDSFVWVIDNKMPWEDLSIGFQCRIDRVPDIYNVDFWHHFTNVYI